MNTTMQQMKLDRIIDCLFVLTQYCLLEFTSLVNIQKLASTQCKDHALIVLLQLVVNLCSDKRGEFSLGERLVFIECLAMTHTSVAVTGVDAAGSKAIA